MWLDQVDDLLLSGGRAIELSAHLSEPPIDLCKSLVHVRAEDGAVLPEVDEALPLGVEARRHRLSPLDSGRRKHIVAVQHSILTAVRHMLTNDADHADLGGD